MCLAGYTITYTLNRSILMAWLSRTTSMYARNARTYWISNRAVTDILSRSISYGPKGTHTLRAVEPLVRAPRVRASEGFKPSCHVTIVHVSAFTQHSTETYNQNRSAVAREFRLEKWSEIRYTGVPRMLFTGYAESGPSTGKVNS